MNETKEKNGGWSDFQIIGLALLFFAGSFAFHLRNAHAGTPIYRDQHLGTAVEYYYTKIDLLKAVIPGFNATGTPTLLELPVWQALTGLAFKIFGLHFVWGNIVSLLLFSTCLFPLYMLARTFIGPRCAAWTLVFFVTQPLVVLYAGEASPDGFALVTEIWFLFFAVRMIQSPGFKWWIPTTLTGSLAAVTKLPLLMAAGIACCLLLLKWKRHSLKAWLLLSSSGLVMVALFFLWTNYTNHCIAIAEYPFVDLRISDPAMKFWYFGDLHYRLSPVIWIKGAWRILAGCFGSFALASLCVYGFFFTKENAFAKFMLIGSIITTLTFTHVILHHSHYYLMFSPAFALLCAQAAAAWETKLVMEQRWKNNLLFGLLAMTLALSVVQGMIDMKIVVDMDPYPYDMAKVILKYSKPTDKLVIEGGGWGGNELILTHLPGMSIWDTKFLENPEHYKRLRELGYNKLVMISDSPLVEAAERITPGQSKQPRHVYRDFLTPIADNWPTVYQDDNILIKDLP